MEENNLEGRVELKLIDITNVKGDRKESMLEIFLSINIYEDLFLPYKTGKITVQDTNDLQSTFPIIGGEKLEVLYRTENDKKPKVQTFKIYKLDEDQATTQSGENKKTLTLYFVSEEQELDSRIKISKHYKGDPNSIIQSILKSELKSKKPFVYDSASAIPDFCANFWTPSKTINFISRSTTAGNRSDFVFFEDKEGFNFKTISGLMEKPKISDLKFEDQLESKWDWNIIQRFKVSKYFDTLQTDTLGNTVFQFDNEKYKFTVEQEDFESISQHATNHGLNVQFHKDFLSNPNILTTFKDNRYIAKRDQLLRTIDKYHMVIQMTGDSTKTVGQVYNIEIRTKQRENSFPNQLLTGNWLITNVRHEIGRTGAYMQNLKCVKNAFFKLNETSKVKGKKNVL